MANPPLAKRVEELLENVHEGWLPLISMEHLTKALTAIDSAGDTDRVAPPAKDIFNFLRDCVPSEIVACIVGQDPYPMPGHATGYCFSAWKPAGFPKSLQPIIDCLVKAQLIKQKPAYGDLRPLAVQGVLLVNAALTTREGATKAHGAHWKPFMNFFIKKLCSLTAARFLLWGADARNLVEAPAKKHGRECFTWSHPSPLSDNQQPLAKKFINCDHFARLNTALEAEKLRPIWWAIDSPMMAFTDGSCPKNGSADAEAGFSGLIVGGHMAPTTVRGLVQPATYALIDPSVPEKGFEANESSSAVTPTNNRGELLGFCWVLLILLRGRALGNIEIISDSDAIVVKMFNEYLPNRRKKGTANQLANFDLITIAESLLDALREQADSVKIIHTRAAHDRPCPPKSSGEGAREACYWHGNAKADALAKQAVDEGVPLVISSNIGAVRRLG
jgi:uracil-DNA glycosylase